MLVGGGFCFCTILSLDSHNYVRSACHGIVQYFVSRSNSRLLSDLPDDKLSRGSVAWWLSWWFAASPDGPLLSLQTWKLQRHTHLRGGNVPDHLIQKCALQFRKYPLCPFQSHPPWSSWFKFDYHPMSRPWLRSRFWFALRFIILIPVEDHCNPLSRNIQRLRHHS